MSLILAIEPDAQQASRLNQVIRRHLRADLVHAETTEGALDALARIGDRVPDLVLVPSLLSPQEDATLAGALRVIATAANVRMLTIPVLADAEPESQAARGLLARWRSRRTMARPPTACDPAVFAAQIAEYLAERHDDSSVEEVSAPPAADEVTEGSSCDVADVITSSVHDGVAAERPDSAAQSVHVVPVAAHPWVDLSQLEPYVWADEVESTVFERDDGNLVVDLSLLQFEEAFLQVEEHAWLDVLDPHVQEPEIEPSEAPVITWAAVSSNPIRNRQSEDDGAVDASTVDALIAPLLREIEQARASDEPRALPPPRQSAAVRHVLEEPEDPLFFVDPPAMPTRAVHPAAAPERPAWVELIESLRQDVERLKQERHEEVVRQESRPRAAAHVARRRQRLVADQWGLFDPDQCGFGALLAKLEEVSAR
jgi:hypothetical protein